MRKILFYTVLWCVCATSFAQGNFTMRHHSSDKIKFELINNLIIIPVEVNGLKLSFLLDSGVSKPILFNINGVSDTLKMDNVEVFTLRGLGADGSIEALKSKNNFVRVGDAINVHQDIYVVQDESINFAPRLGVPIHGIIGYDLLKDFVVEINYSSKYLRFSNPKTYKYKNCKRCKAFDLTLYKNKPYIDAIVGVHGKDVPVKLLIDSGGSDALWLFNDKEQGLFPHEEMFFADYLGKGLSGDLHGKRSKVNTFSLNDFKLKNVNVAYPDSSSISLARRFKARSGSMSGELLKRFNVIFDYPSKKITLKPNGNFRDPFYYNKSGIVLEQEGLRVVKMKEKPVMVENFGTSTNTGNNLTVYNTAGYSFHIKPAFRIVELRLDSPADKAGLLKDDVILAINNKDTHDLKLQEVNQMFRAEDGKLIKLKVDREGRIMDFQFKLENVFKQKSSQ
ncbi:MAG: signaling protein [Bacteroidetes bacterium MedPE-SWsnd-G2]|nr:MAG: signaling protein [Bacteroidetes bacterium MedPE-SWsnd-G2]